MRSMFTLRWDWVTDRELAFVVSRQGQTRVPPGTPPRVRKELKMALLPGTLSRAGLLSSDILDLQVTEYGPSVRVVTVVGEVDALVAPELASFLTAQLIVAMVVVADLNGVRYLSSAGLRALFEANEFAMRECRDLLLICHSQTANWALRATGLRDRFTFIDDVPYSAVT
jgi:anti-anti-sigma factor